MAVRALSGRLSGASRRKPVRCVVGCLEPPSLNPVSGPCDQLEVSATLQRLFDGVGFLAERCGYLVDRRGPSTQQGTMRSLIGSFSASPSTPARSTGRTLMRPAAEAN